MQALARQSTLSICPVIDLKDLVLSHFDVVKVGIFRRSVGKTNECNRIVKSVAKDNGPQIITGDDVK
jgi:hypothetical protein